MNYYGNSYNNQYPYPNYNQQAVIPQPMQQSMLNGKIVDSKDVVKATEVPVGGYGIFPKADLSEIYIKSWQANGTTKINTYQPIVETEPTEVSQNSLSQLIEKINGIETKLDSILSVPKKEVKSVAF